MGAPIRGFDHRRPIMEYMILIYGDERTFGSLDKVGSVEVRPLDPMTK
jgi:hypothetical protein